MSISIDYGVTILPQCDPQGSALGSEFLAAFRDPRAVCAFENANPRLQACLIEAGIAPIVATDDTPQGYFADRDREVQAHVRACVVDALESELDDADFDDPVFDTRAFLNSLGQARAFGAVAVVDAELAAQPGASVFSKVGVRASRLKAYVSPAAGAIGVLAGSGFLFGGFL